MMWPFPDEGSFSGDRRRFPGMDDPDVRLTYRVAEALLNDARTRHQRVTVEVQNRVVLLGGVVDERSVKVVVRDIARAVPGVTDTCDAIRVARGNDQEPGPSDEDRFRSIVADLQTGPSHANGSLGMAPMPVVVMWATLAAVAWAVLTVLMVTAQWAGVAVTCAVIGLVITVVNRRRRRRGDADTPAER